MRRAAVAVGVAFTLAGCGPGLQDLSVGQHVAGSSYPLTIVFADASGLPIGGRVELNDTDVGRVQSMSTHGYRAYVKVRVTSSVKLPHGTTATLSLTTPLGEEYVELTPPSAAGDAPPLPPGSTIQVGSTTRAPDVEDLLTAFSAILNGGGLEQLRTIVTQLNAALAGHEHQAGSLLVHVNTILTALNSHTAQIDHTLHAVAQLSHQLAVQRGLLATALVQLNPSLHALRTDVPGFTRLLTALSRLGVTATQVLGDVQAGFVANLRGLSPTLATLVRLRSRLHPTLVHLHTFERLLSRAVPGDYLNQHVTVKQ